MCRLCVRFPLDFGVMSSSTKSSMLDVEEEMLPKLPPTQHRLTAAGGSLARKPSAMLDEHPYHGNLGIGSLRFSTQAGKQNVEKEKLRETGD